MWCFAFAVLVRCLRCLFSCSRSWDHQRFANGDGLVFGTISWMVSVIASFRCLSRFSAARMERMGFGLGSYWRCCWSLVSNLSQSVTRKLYLGVSFVSSGVIMHSVIMGKWSVFTGVSCSTTSHLIIASIKLSELKTLSGLV